MAHFAHQLGPYAQFCQRQTRVGDRPTGAQGNRAHFQQAARQEQRLELFSRAVRQVRDQIQAQMPGDYGIIVSVHSAFSFKPFFLPFVVAAVT